MDELTKIKLGTVANDGTGDSLRVGGETINNNFGKVKAQLDKMLKADDIASEADIAAATTGKIIDAAGLVSVLPSACGFSANSSGAIFVAQGATIKLTGFSTPLFDTHNAFSAGTFKAPKAGIYLFEVYAQTSQTWGTYTGDVITVNFYKNNVLFKQLSDYAATFSDGRTTIQKVILMSLNLDDLVNIGLFQYFASNGANFGYSFAGARIG